MLPTKNLLGAEPAPVDVVWAKTALVIIDTQRDVLRLHQIGSGGPAAIEGARDITSFGGWRAFIAAQVKSA